MRPLDAARRAGAVEPYPDRLAEIAVGMESHFTKGLHKVIVPGAGHFVHQEKPEEVNRELVEFLKQ